MHDAFISYSNSEPDNSVARKLHTMLEQYNSPKLSDGKKKKKLDIFIDYEELECGSLTDRLKDSLAQSRYLIVLCSFRSSKSVWVNEEIKAFLKTHKKDHILPLLIEGSPEVSFPPALLEVSKLTITTANKSTKSIFDILAPNIEAPSIKQSIKILKTEKLRLIAPMLGCTYDDLRNRQGIRQKKRRQFIGLLTITLAIFTSGYSGWTRTNIYQVNSILAADIPLAVVSQQNDGDANAAEDWLITLIKIGQTERALTMMIDLQNDIDISMIVEAAMKHDGGEIAFSVINEIKDNYKKSLLVHSIATAIAKDKKPKRAEEIARQMETTPLKLRTFVGIIRAYDKEHDNNSVMALLEHSLQISNDLVSQLNSNEFDAEEITNTIFDLALLAYSTNQKVLAIKIFLVALDVGTIENNFYFFNRPINELSPLVKLDIYDRYLKRMKNNSENYLHANFIEKISIALKLDGRAYDAVDMYLKLRKSDMEYAFFPSLLLTELWGTEHGDRFWRELKPTIKDDFYHLGGDIQRLKDSAVSIILAGHPEFAVDASKLLVSSSDRMMWLRQVASNIKKEKPEFNLSILWEEILKIYPNGEPELNNAFESISKELISAMKFESAWDSLQKVTTEERYLIDTEIYAEISIGFLKKGQFEKAKKILATGYAARLTKSMAFWSYDEIAPFTRAFYGLVQHLVQANKLNELIELQSFFDVTDYTSLAISDIVIADTLDINNYKKIALEAYKRANNRIDKLHREERIRLKSHIAFLMLKFEHFNDGTQLLNEIRIPIESRVIEPDTIDGDKDRYIRDISAIYAVSRQQDNVSHILVEDAKRNDDLEKWIDALRNSFVLPNNFISNSFNPNEKVILEVIYEALVENGHETELTNHLIKEKGPAWGYFPLVAYYELKNNMGNVEEIALSAQGLTDSERKVLFKKLVLHNIQNENIEKVRSFKHYFTSIEWVELLVLTDENSNNGKGSFEQILLREILQTLAEGKETGVWLSSNPGYVVEIAARIIGNDYDSIIRELLLAVRSVIDKEPIEELRSQYRYIVAKEFARRELLLDARETAIGCLDADRLKTYSAILEAYYGLPLQSDFNN